ncbi:multiheme c-type cytochrome [Bacteroidota bacterium]
MISLFTYFKCQIRKNKQWYILLYSSTLFLVILLAGFRFTIKVDNENHYVGSHRCAECHNDIYDKWSKSSHSKGFQEPTADQILTEFSGKIILADPINEIPETEFLLDDNGGNGPFSVLIKAKKFDVDYIHGGYSSNDKQRRGHGTLQRFLTVIDGKLIHIPFAWNPINDFHGNKQGWIPVDLNSWITRDGELKKIQNTPRTINDCAKCHFTGMEQDQESDIFRFSEYYISCEACHDQGKIHIISERSKDIQNPGRLKKKERLIFCMKCHTKFEKKNDKEWDLPHTNARMPCWACHDPHGSEYKHHLIADPYNNSLCLSCHDQYQETSIMENHSHHPSSNPESPLCVDCHMSPAEKDGVHFENHGHSFDVAAPENTLLNQKPNVCQMCHRSYNEVQDNDMLRWDEESDVIISTWLHGEFKRMFQEGDKK